VILLGAMLAGIAWVENMSAQDRSAPAGAASTKPKATQPAAAPAAARPAAAPVTTKPAAVPDVEAPKAPAPAATAAPAASKPAPVPAAAPAATQQAPRPAAPVEAARPEWQAEAPTPGQPDKFVTGSLDPASGYLFQVEMVRRGSAISTIKLATAFVTVADKKLFDEVKHDEARYQAARLANPAKYHGHYSLLNPLPPFLPYATRSITVAVGEEAVTRIPLDLIEWRHVATQVLPKPADGVEVTFEATLYRDANHLRPDLKADYQQALKVTKTYHVLKQDYSLTMSINVHNLLKLPMRMYVDQLGPTGIPVEDVYRTDDRFCAYGKLEGDAKSGQVQVPQRMGTDLLGQDNGVYKIPTDVPVALGRTDDAAPVLWVGEGNRFFASMLYLRPTLADQLAAVGWQADFDFFPAMESPYSRAFVTGVRVGGARTSPEKFEHTPNLSLAAGKARQMDFDIFAGPKKREMFNTPDAPYFHKLYKELNYLGTINLQSCFFSWNALTLGMMWLLQAITHTVAFGNYGVAIMILVVLVRAALHWLTKKSQLNMMKMQELAPEMEKLKKQYANNKEQLQKEMMTFYKKQGATPILGCLPMFLQMPIWISLWGSLNAAVELRHAAFLPVWITDLAGPDTIISWGGNFLIPFLGSMTGPIRGFNLLPLLLTVAMFLQTKYGPQMGQPSAASTPDQERQKKMMMYMMPGMMLLFFYNQASGLTLYIMTSTFAGLAEQHIIRKSLALHKAVGHGYAYDYYLRARAWAAGRGLLPAIGEGKSKSSRSGRRKGR
jgi:YidC/Oxa1 family membrane protein insertase